MLHKIASKLADKLFSVFNHNNNNNTCLKKSKIFETQIIHENETINRGGDQGLL